MYFILSASRIGCAHIIVRTIVTAPLINALFPRRALGRVSNATSLKTQSRLLMRIRVPFVISIVYCPPPGGIGPRNLGELANELTDIFRINTTLNWQNENIPRLYEAWTAKEDENKFPTVLFARFFSPENINTVKKEHGSVFLPHYHISFTIPSIIYISRMRNICANII